MVYSHCQRPRHLHTILYNPFFICLGIALGVGWYKHTINIAGLSVYFITTRVRSTTGRLCFDTCLSVCPQGGGQSADSAGGGSGPADGGGGGVRSGPAGVGGVRSSWRGGGVRSGPGGVVRSSRWGGSGPAGGGGVRSSQRGGGGRVSQDRTT